MFLREVVFNFEYNCIKGISFNFTIKFDKYYYNFKLVMRVNEVGARGIDWHHLLRVDLRFILFIF